MTYKQDNLKNILEIIQREFESSKSKPFIIAIDGRGGGGKSSFGKKLEASLNKTKRFNLDAYTVRSGDFFAPELVEIEHKLDWENKEYQITKIQNEIKNTDFEIVILEGCFSFKNLNDIAFDLKIFVDCQKDLAANRLNQREIAERTEIDPKIIKNSTYQWQLAEDRYYQSFNPKEKADLVISTTNDSYDLVVDRTEWRPEVMEFQKRIKTWWQTTFPNQKLESIEIPSHGMNCNYILNSKYVLKTIQPKYIWDKSSYENYDAIMLRAKYIQEKDLDFIPKIIQAGYSSILEYHFILSEFLPSKDLFQLYYKATLEEKTKYLKDFIALIKIFHQKCKDKIHGDLHFGNVLVSEQKMYLIDFDNLEDGQPFDEFYGIIQGLLLPSCCVSQELEIHYPEPLIVEFEEIIRQYPELLPKDKLEEAKKVFRDCFDDKLKRDKFKESLEPVYKKVFEEGWLESLSKNNLQI